MRPSAHIRKLRFAIIAVDVVLFRMEAGRLQVLLGEVTNPFFRGRRGLIGGVVRPQETAEEAVRNHLRAKAGIRGVYAEQLQTFSRLDRDPRGRVLSVAYLALAATDPQHGKGSLKTWWVPVAKAQRLAYDHNEILCVALERLRAKLGYTNIAQYLLPRAFTLTDLQQVYETVLGRKLDKRNFRRKVLQTSLVRSTGTTTKKGTKRPAQLFTFSAKQPTIIEIL